MRRILVIAVSAGCTLEAGKEVPPVKGDGPVVVDKDTQRVRLNTAQVPVLESCAHGQVVRLGDLGFECSAPEVPWTGVTDKPLVFSPDTHSHPAGQVSDFREAAIDSMDGATVGGSFSIDGDGSVGGNLSVGGSFSAGEDLSLLPWRTCKTITLSDPGAGDLGTQIGAFLDKYRCMLFVLPASTTWTWNEPITVADFQAVWIYGQPRFTTPKNSHTVTINMTQNRTFVVSDGVSERNPERVYVGYHAYFSLDSVNVVESANDARVLSRNSCSGGALFASSGQYSTITLAFSTITTSEDVAAVGWTGFVNLRIYHTYIDKGPGAPRDIQAVKSYYGWCAGGGRMIVHNTFNYPGAGVSFPSDSKIAYTEGCATGWTDRGTFCSSPLQPANTAHDAQIKCIAMGADTCSVGQLYRIGTGACDQGGDSDRCWSNSYCGSTSMVWVQSGVGWACAGWNDNSIAGGRTYYCCRSKY